MTFYNDRLVPTGTAKNRQPLWLNCAVLALHLTYAGNVLWVFSGKGQEAGLGSWIASIGGIGLIAAGLLRFTTGRKLGTNAMLWFLVSGVIVTLMASQTLLRDDLADGLYFALNLLPWVALCTIPLLGWPVVPDRLLKTFRVHGVIGVFLCALILVTNRHVLLAQTLVRSDGLAFKQAQYLLYPVQFLFFRYALESKLVRWVTLLGLAEVLSIAVVGGSRQPVGILGLTVVLGLWVLWRQRSPVIRRRSGVHRLRTVILIVVAVSSAAILIRYEIRGGYQLLMDRFAVDHGQSSLAENARWDEVRLLLDQFGLVDYAWGRGILGNFVNSAAPKQDSVHIGLFRCLLKGGVPLVLLVFWGPLFVGLRLLVRSRSARTLAVAANCVYFGVKNLTGNIILPFPFYYITLLTFGECLGATQNQTAAHRAPGQVQLPLSGEKETAAQASRHSWKHTIENTLVR